MAIKLMNRDEEVVLYTSSDACKTIKEAIEEAVAADVQLAGLDVCGQHLEGLNCGCGKFDNSEWKGAFLQGANLAGSKMRNAILRGAFMQGANLGGNLMSGADLDGIKVDADTSFAGTDWTTKIGEDSEDSEDKPHTVAPVTTA